MSNFVSYENGQALFGAVGDKFDDVFATMGANGAKNLLKLTPLVGTRELNGVTFTVYRNDDGQVIKIVANGTATANSYIPLFSTNGTYYDAEFIGKRVILTGCPVGGSTNTYFIDAYRAGSRDGSSGTVDDTGDGVEFNWLNDGSGTAANLTINVQSGTRVDNLEFFPMIRLASDPDSTFVPYVMTNEEITRALAYLEQTVTLSTSAATAVTFTDARITANSCIEVGTSEWGLVPDSVTVSAGSCVVTLPQAETAHSVVCRIYLR